jgi:glyoxylase-like metal-dependent hydrolase (beta-lactamase superfamily II)
MRPMAGTAETAVAHRIARRVGRPKPPGPLFFRGRAAPPVVYDFRAMKLTALDAGHFRLDAGSMFGRVPKPLWNKVVPADERNRMDVACRCLLIESGDRRILLDNGNGVGRGEKFCSIYAYDPAAKGIEGELARVGVAPETITDVVLTHLHFDHAGGTTKPSPGGARVLVCPNADHHVSRAHWEWAKNPPRLEQASYVREDFALLDGHARLKLIESNRSFIAGFPQLICLRYDGHSEGFHLPLLDLGGRKLLYISDLTPTIHHVRLPFIMGFDIRPLKTYEAKQEILGRAADENWGVFFEHDPAVEVATIRRERDDFGIERTMGLGQWLSG